MAKTTSNIGELNARIFTVSFENDGTPTSPSTVHWRMTCPDDDDAQIVDWTSVSVSTGLAPDGYTTTYYSTIDVPSTAHAMQTDNDKERRAICVAADKDLSTEWNEEWIYWVEKREARS